MTRFARAKGSKASNEKAPEDSTPWEVMKEQLLQAKKEKDESKNRQEAEQQRIKNYENFLKEHKVQKRKATWCDFPETEAEKQKCENSVSKIKIKTKHGITEKSVPDQTLSICKYAKSPPKKNKITSDDSQIQTEQNPDISKTEISGKEAGAPNSTKKKKKRNKNKSSEKSNIQQQEIKSDSNKIKENSEKSSDNAPTSIEQYGSQPSGRLENKDNFKKDKAQPTKKRKDKKLVNGKPQRRKDVNDKSFQIIINGAEVELERVDGFPVMRKDAERLNELRKNMIQKGIPKSEIQRTMKLERRRAEKALARVRKQVCYNCRKGGHNLSDCPELKSKIPDAETGEGICFKCGSTEHRQFECKVQRDKEFRFATCFICKEPGHIARQCPDNPKGLYPNGGCCKLCGDVTHLRKDCPTVMDKKEDKSIKLSTFGSVDDVEGISQQTIKVGSDEPAKKVKKITF